MIRTLSVLTTLLLWCIVSYAQENYAINKIPVELKKNADAIVRDYQTSINIKSLTEISVSEKIAITILNEKGIAYSRFCMHYDKLIKPGKIKGILYDAAGEEIKKTKNSDFLDAAKYGYSFYDDDHYKTHDFHYSNYPFTISYETEKTYTTLFLINTWMPKDEYNMAIEKASIDIVSPVQIPLQFKTFHIAEQVERKEENGFNIFHLSQKNIPAEEEDNMNEFTIFPYPALVLTTDTLKLGEVYGSMKSWKSFGKLFYELNKGRDMLPEKTKEVVHKLTDTCTSEFSKISVLYEYVKNTTRYVSIQLGIGGWQTFEAAFVAEKGYGDCKALTNYMKALLHEAGIASNEALVLAGRNKNIKLQENTVFDCFNHVILCVPGTTDTTWLECTGKTTPAGYLSSFTADRDVLVSTPRGGYITHTPVYNATHNYTTRTSTLHVTSTGEIEGNITSTYAGSQYDKEYGHYYLEPTEKTEKYLNSKFNLTSYHIKNFSHSVSTNKYIPCLTVKSEVAGKGNVQQAGNRLFISPVISAVTIETIPIEKSRTKPFKIKESYKISDTTIFIVTGNAYTSEFLPENSQQSYSFGEFQSFFSFENGNTVKYIRMFRLKEGLYAPEHFNDYKKLIKEATAMDRQKEVVLLKKD
jgi:hypothetical protein